MFFGAYRMSPQSKSMCEGHSVSSHAVRPMISLRSPFRFPARWTLRVAFRGVGRGERRGVLWDVSHETGQFPVNFSMPFWRRPCHHAGMSGVPVRWLYAVPCRRHAMRSVPYMSGCGVFRFPSGRICRQSSNVGRRIWASRPSSRF